MLKLITVLYIITLVYADMCPLTTGDGIDTRYFLKAELIVTDKLTKLECVYSVRGEIGPGRRRWEEYESHDICDPDLTEFGLVREMHPLHANIALSDLWRRVDRVRIACVAPGTPWKCEHPRNAHIPIRQAVDPVFAQKRTIDLYC